MQTLANGERWELYGTLWHLMNGGHECPGRKAGCNHQHCYMPVGASQFDAYAHAIEVQVETDRRAAERVRAATRAEVSEYMTVPMAELRVGDEWFYYGGWHRVNYVDHAEPGYGPNSNGTRTYARIQAITAVDGEHTYGTREWSTALRSDLAAKRECRIRRPI